MKATLQQKPFFSDIIDPGSGGDNLSADNVLKPLYEMKEFNELLSFLQSNLNT